MKNHRPSLDTLLKTKPYEHQKQAFLRARRKKAFALLMEQGTGKTPVTIGLILYRYLRKEASRVVVVTPNSVIGEWERQFSEHSAMNIDVHTLLGRLSERRKYLTKLPHKGTSLTVVLTNYPGLRELADAFIWWRPDMVVLDESQKIKSHKTKQSKAAHKLGKHVPYRLILTGTPVSESPLDIWSQYKFLNADIFHTRWTDFRDNYAVMGGYAGYKIVKYKNLEDLAQRAYSIAYRVTKEEALDLPETVDQKLTVELSGQELAFYKEMHKNFIVTLSEQEVISAPMVLTQLMKLQQLTSAFIKQEDGTIKSWKSSKLQLLKEIILDLPSHRKVVVFAKFIHEIETISQMLTHNHINNQTFMGATKNRQQVIDSFQNKKNPRVLVIQESTGGLGITLTAASVAIFYSMNHSYVDYDQARARIHRIGQDSKVTYIHLLAKDTVDEAIYKNVKSKGALANLVIDILGREKKIIE